MSILLQPQLFPFDEFADLDDDNSRLALVLWTLPDARLLRWLDEQRAGRRDLYPQVMLCPGGGGGCRAGSLSVAGKLLDLGLRLGAQAANRGLLQRLRPT